MCTIYTDVGYFLEYHNKKLSAACLHKVPQPKHSKNVQLYSVIPFFVWNRNTDCIAAASVPEPAPQQPKPLFW